MAVRDDVDDNQLRVHPIDQSIGLEEDLAIFGNSKGAKLVRARTPIGSRSESLGRLKESVQDLVSLAWRIYRRTKNLRAVQLLLGHSKLESTVRYLGIEVDDALEMAEQTEV